jgi:hypothetical protein
MCVMNCCFPNHKLKISIMISVRPYVLEISTINIYALYSFSMSDIMLQIIVEI